MEKKNVLDYAIRWEILNNLYQTLDILFKLNFIDYKSESSAFCWIEDEPKKKDKIKFLREAGYNI